MAKQNKSNENLTKKQREELDAKLRLRMLLLIVGGVILALCLVFVGVYALKNKDNTASAAQAADFAPVAGAEYARDDDPVATITMADGGVIRVRLYPAAAPNTVANFVELANSGFYDGLTFHRVISGFMIQGGDPDGVGTGGPGYSIAGEFSANGVENNLSHTRGVISMARSSAFDSAGSQFFIMHADGTYLDGQYAAFGEVIDGMDAVDAIAAVQTGANDKPVEDVVIQSITVETNGVEYVANKIQ